MARFDGITNRTNLLETAFGLHVITGDEIMHSVDIVGTEKQITILQALGDGDTVGWGGIERMLYSGRTLDSTNSRFHPGHMASDANDSANAGAMAVDQWFPNGLNYSGTAYVAVRLPPGVGDEENPGANLKGVFRCMLVPDYTVAADGTPTLTGYSYSANPARIAAFFLIDRRGLPLSRIDWKSWKAWRDYCEELITWTGGQPSTTPAAVLAWSAGSSAHVLIEGQSVRKVTGGNAWNGYVRSNGVGANASGARGVQFTIRLGATMAGLTTTAATPSAPTYQTGLLLAYMEVGGALKLWANGSQVGTFAGTTWRIGDSVRIWHDAAWHVELNGRELSTAGMSLPAVPSSGTTIYAAVAAHTQIWAEHSTLSAGVNNASFYPEPVASTANADMTVKRFEAHLAFLQPANLQDILDQICGVSASDFQDDGEQIRFITPQPVLAYGVQPAAGEEARRRVAHRFTEDNVASRVIRAWELDKTERWNRVQGRYRNIDSENFDTDYVYDTRDQLRDSTENGLIVDPGPIELPNMNRSQAERLIKWLTRVKSDMKWFCAFRGLGDSIHVLPGDVVEISLARLGWVNKRFVVIDATDESGEAGADERQFLCQEYQDGLYLDTDTTAAPPVDEQPTGPDPTAPPPLVADVDVTEGGERGHDGAWLIEANLKVRFAGFGGRQYGVAYYRKQGTLPWLSNGQEVEPHPETKEAVIQIRGGLDAAVYEFRVVTTSRGIGASLGLDAAETYAFEFEGNTIQPEAVTDLAAAPNAAGTGAIFKCTIPASVTDFRFMRVFDGAGAIVIEELGSNTFEVPYPSDGSNIVRKVKIFNRSMIESEFSNTATAVVAAPAPPSGTAYELMEKGNIVLKCLAVEGVTYEWSTTNAVDGSGVFKAGADGRVVVPKGINPTLGSTTYNYFVRASRFSKRSAFVQIAIPYVRPGNPGLGQPQSKGGEGNRKRIKITPPAVPANGAAIAGFEVRVSGVPVEFVSSAGTNPDLGYEWSEPPGKKDALALTIFTVDVHGVYSDGGTSDTTAPPVVTPPSGFTARFNGTHFEERCSAFGLTWQSLTGYSADAHNNLTKTAASGYSNGGATSAEVLSGDGFAAVRTSLFGAEGMFFGLTTLAAINSAADIAFGIAVNNTGYFAMRNGAATLIAGVAVDSGHDLRVAVERGKALLYINDVLRHTFADAPVLPMRVGALTFANGHTIVAARLETGRVVELEFARDAGFTTGSYRTRDRERFELPAELTTRTHNRYLRKWEGGVPSAAVTAAVSNCEAPVAPTLAKDAARATNFELPINITTTTDRVKIRATLIQVRASGGSWPATTGDGVSGNFRVSGAPVTVMIPWAAGGTVEYRVAHEDLFTRSLAVPDHQWTEMVGVNAHTFPKLGDSAIDATASFMRKASYRFPVVTGGGVIGWGARSPFVPSEAPGLLQRLVAPTSNQTFTRVTNARTVYVVTRHNTGASSTGDESLMGDLIDYPFCGTGVPSPAIIHPSVAGGGADLVRGGTCHVNGASVTPTAALKPTQLSVLAFVATGNIALDRVGSDRGIAGRNWNGEFKEVLVYSAAHSAAERQSVENYLGAEWDVAVNGAIPASAPALNTGKASWSHDIIVEGVGTAVSPTGRITLAANPAGTTLAAGQGIIFRHVLGATTATAVVVALSTWQPPDETATTAEILIFRRNDDGTLSNYLQVPLRDGEIMDAAVVIPMLTSYAARINDLIIRRVRSDNYVPHGTQTSQTEVLKWQNPVGGQLDAAGVFTQTAATGSTDQIGGVVSTRSVVGGAFKLLVTIPDTTTGLANTFIGMNYTDEAGVSHTHSDYCFRWHTSTYGGNVRLEVFEAGTVRYGDNNAWITGDQLEISYNGATQITYTRIRSGVRLVLYTNNAAAPRFPLLVDANTFANTAQLDPAKVTLTGLLCDTNPEGVRWTSRVNVAMQSDGRLKDVAASGTYNAGAASHQRLAGDFMVEQKAHASTVVSEPSLILSPVQTTPQVLGAANANAAHGMHFSSSGSFYYITGGNYSAALGTWAAGDVFAMRRVGSTLTYLKNGVVIHTVAGVTAAYYLQAAYAGVNGLLAKPLLRVPGAMLQGLNIDGERGEVAIGGSVTVPGGYRFDEFTGRAVEALTTNRQFRGNDFGPPEAGYCTALSLASAVIAEGGADTATVKLAYVTPARGVDGDANFDSCARVLVRVFNQFGEVIHTEGPHAFVPGAGQLEAFTHPRAYADPADQAIYEVTFENVDGWSYEAAYLQAGSKVQKPAYVTRARTMLSASARAVNSYAINATARGTASNASSFVTEYREVGQTVWKVAGGGNPIPPIGHTMDTDDRIAADTLYDLRFRHTVFNTLSNYVRVRTHQPGSNATRGIYGKYSSVASGLQFGWEPPSGAWTVFRIYRSVNGGAWALLYSSPHNLIAPFYSDTTVTAENTYRYVVRYEDTSTVAYYYPASEMLTVYAEPLATGSDPTNFGLNVVSSERVDASWLVNAATGAVYLEHRVQNADGTWPGAWTTQTLAALQQSGQISTAGLAKGTIIEARVRVADAGTLPSNTARAAVAVGALYYM